MNFHFVTLFPHLITPYFEDSILKRAISNNIINITCHNPRDFTTNKHKKVDFALIGGTAGMLISTQPMFDTLNHIKQNFSNTHIIFLVPAGKKFNQKDAIRLAKKENIVFVCGRYDGIDERVVEYFADEVLSIGDFILTGGELASLVVCDAICRNITGVLGNINSLDEESFCKDLLEAPNFTKPIKFDKISIPSEYLKGNHSRISTLKTSLSISKTKYYRPDLIKKYKIKDKK
ncbi:MAG: tRNA (guanosine(37)-N1)-methyltransferase TrmD [Campylobacterales bacterium]|nr:tRNA (guanosine(37)-N1)-methyltransferase TrmD [Campylobacterales bacterium]